MTDSNFDPQKIIAALDPKALDLLGNAIVGARTEFTEWGKDVSTFGTQLNQVTEIITKSGGAINELGNALGTPIPQSLIKSFDMLIGNQLRAADTAINLQNGFMNLASATGSLGQFYNSVGPNLENVGDLLNSQIDYLTSASSATGAGLKVTQGYYNELGKIPKALTEVIYSSDASSSKISKLTAVMRLAHGTSRNTSEIIQDLGRMYNNLGLVGEPSLTFTSRFSEISNKFGVQLSVVKESLMGVTQAYSGYVNVGEAAKRLTEGSTSVMNNYMESLKSTGLTGEQSAQLLGKAFTNIANMSDAQKSFLSSQMGGPGGLQGSFKMDMMIREGKSEEIFENIKQDLSKRFGKFVSEKEASESQEAASELKKQMAFLRQGPYGSIVTDDRQAIRMLEMFKAKEEGGAGSKETQLSKDVLSSYLDKGNTIENQTRNPATQIRDLLEAANLKKIVTTLEAIKDFTALGNSPLSESLRINKSIKDSESALAAEDNLRISRGQVALPRATGLASLQDEGSRALGDLGLAGNELSNKIINKFSPQIETIKKFLSDKKDNDNLKIFNDAISESSQTKDPQKIKTLISTFLSQKQAEDEKKSQTVAPNALALSLLPKAVKEKQQEAYTAYAPPAQSVAPRADVTKTAQRLPAQQMQQPILNAKLNVELNTKCSVCGHDLETSHSVVNLLSPGATAQ